MAQGTTRGVPIDTDPLLAADSDLLVPSQKAVKSYTQPQLNGTGFVKATGTTISYDNSTYLTSVGTGVANQITYWSGTNTIASLATATYPSLTELSYVKGVTSSLQTQLSAKLNTTSYEWMQAQGFQGLGSTIKGVNLAVPSISSATTSVALASQTMRFVAYYLPQSVTITGVKFYQVVQGVYTGNNYNGVGLYSYSGGVLTLVASTTNDANFWTGATGWATKPFSGTYSASSGTFYIGLLYSSSAQTTAPTIAAGTAAPANGFQTVDFTNSAKIHGAIASQTSLPSPTINISTIGSNTGNPSILLY